MLRLTRKMTTIPSV